jgi:hypothetical protein
MAVGLEDAHRSRGADPMGVQEDHDLPHRLLLGPARARCARPAWGRCRAPLQALGLASMISKVFSPKARRCAWPWRTDAAHVPEARYFSMPSAPVGGGLEDVGPELEAVHPVRDPRPVAVIHSPSPDGGRMAHHGGQITLAAYLHSDDAEAALGIVEGDALDVPASASTSLPVFSTCPGRTSGSCPTRPEVRVRSLTVAPALATRGAMLANLTGERCSCYVHARGQSTKLLVRTAVRDWQRAGRTCLRRGDILRAKNWRFQALSSAAT